VDLKVTKDHQVFPASKVKMALQGFQALLVHPDSKENQADQEILDHQVFLV
jgi:hypothetical protein